MYRDWGITIAAFGLFLLASAATLCALFGVVVCVSFLVTEGHWGYLLAVVGALGLACILGAAAYYFFTVMRDA